MNGVARRRGLFLFACLLSVCVFESIYDDTLLVHICDPKQGTSCNPRCGSKITEPDFHSWYEVYPKRVLAEWELYVACCCRMAGLVAEKGFLCVVLFELGEMVHVTGHALQASKGLFVVLLAPHLPWL